MFSISDPCKTCPDCRAIDKKSKSTPEAKERIATYEQSDGRKAGRKKYWTGPKGKAVQSRHNKTEGRKVKMKAHWKTDKGKATKKRSSSKLSSKMLVSLRKMVQGKHDGPVSIPRLGCFRNNEDVQSHFKSLFEPWMTMQNQGPLRAKDGYNTRWHVGHRLPIAIFDEEVHEDVKRCWHARNLFPQCARRNVELGDALALTDAELLELKDSWPTRATCLASLKALFGRVKL
ncbi:MAG: hypothetical protein CMK83_01075 [Pseudomonadales bacterium]|nr:hypothetical protein [Pseudomonadales bacterium]|tara:strand:- start:60 stop:752 length:693 start_codon:yes stop_codon:yes gene_type:complete